MSGGGRSKESLYRFASSAEVMTFGPSMNKASLLVLLQDGLLDRETCQRIASAIDAVIRESGPDGDGPDASSFDYLDFESRMIARIGPEASLVHIGRSRQDMFSTSCRAVLREATLTTMQRLVTVRARLVAVAGEHVDTVIPAYTHGVQAQPTTFAHYLLALADGLGRAFRRLAEAYARVNRSPLGAGALSTSSVRLDRELLARLLGFDGVVENSYDANHVGSVDSVLEVASALSVVATHISQFAQDLHAGQASPQPWLHIREGDLTGISSMMPQKRNPQVLESLRGLCAVTIGRSQTLFLVAHNANTGMTETRSSIGELPDEEIGVALHLVDRLLQAIEVFPDRAELECRRDYSTMTEVADRLYHGHGVAFRVGHEFASRLTDHGRSAGQVPHEIPYDVARRIFDEVTGDALPLSEAEYAAAIDPVSFVRTRAGLGGPQPAEVRRMLGRQDDEIRADAAHAAALRAGLDDAAADLDARFDQLLRAAPVSADEPDRA